MENFSRLAAFGFSPLPQDTDESIDPPSYLDRLAEAEPDALLGHDAYRHEPPYATTNGFPGFRQFFHDNARCSSVDSWSSAYSAPTSTPFTTSDNADLSTSGFDSRSSTSDPQDADPTIDNQLFNANGKRDNPTPSVRTTTKKRKTVTGNYTRHVDKPPYSYQGLIVTAIQNSRDKELTLGAVHSWFRQNFEFFRGNYTGWRDSVRHNLSSSKCFYRETRDPLPGQPRRPQNYWKVHLSMISNDVFRRQESPLGKTGLFAPYIHEELGLPPIQLPPKTESSDKVEVRREVPVPKPAGVAKPKTTKRRKSGDNVNVKLPKKFQKQNKSLTESPEVLRHSSSTDQKVDTPNPTKKTDNDYEAITPSKNSAVTEPESPQITPAISDLLSYLTKTGEHTYNNNAVQDAVQNLSLLCGLSQDRLDLNTSFQEREEDKCLDKSPAPRVNTPTNKSEVNIPNNSAFGKYQPVPTTDVGESVKTSESFYPVFHQVSTCNGQNFTPVYTSAISSFYRHQQPVFLHNYPVVCLFQTMPTSTFYNHLHYSSSVSPFVPTLSSHTRYQVFNPVLHSGHGLVQRPRSVSPDQSYRDVTTERLNGDSPAVKRDSARTSCMFANSKDDLKIKSESSDWSRHQVFYLKLRTKLV